MVMSDDDYTIDQHDLLLMMAQHLITTGAHAIAPLRCDYGHCERSKGKVTSKMLIVMHYIIHRLDVLGYK